MPEKLDPRPDLDTSYRWNIALWVAREDFSVLYDDLVQVRKCGARILDSSKPKHNLRIGPPKGDDREKRKLFRRYLKTKFDGRMSTLNMLLRSVRCMMEGRDIKVDCPDISSAGV